MLTGILFNYLMYMLELPELQNWFIVNNTKLTQTFLPMFVNYLIMYTNLYKTQEDYLLTVAIPPFN